MARIVIGKVVGDKGKDFKYEDFTQEQLDNLKGPKGDRGETGPAGTTDYNLLKNIPTVNGQLMKGDIDFLLGSYNNLTDKPALNGEELNSNSKLKTINGNSIIGSGDIEILGGEITGVGRKYPGSTFGEIFNDYANNKARGMYSHVEGVGNDTDGAFTHVEGSNNAIHADTCHAEGSHNVVTNSNGHIHVEGNLNAINSTHYSHIEGVSHKVMNGGYNHIEGKKNTITDNSDSTICHIEGTENSIGSVGTAKAVHIEGRNNSIIYSTNGAHVEGYNNNVGGYDNHIEGRFHNIKGACIHAEGVGHDVLITDNQTGHFSHLEGYTNYVTNNYEHAEGTYNFSTSGKTLHSVGIGYFNSNPSATEPSVVRKNAFEIWNDGNIFIYNVNGYNGKNASENNSLQRYFISQNLEIRLLKNDITKLTNKITELETKLNALQPNENKPTV